MPKHQHTGGAGAVWHAHGDLVDSTGPRGGFVAIGKALARRSLDERNANARLMAAAPEMLRALQAVALEAGRCGLSWDTCALVSSAIAAAASGDVSCDHRDNAITVTPDGRFFCVRCGSHVTRKAG